MGIPDPSRDPSSGRWRTLVLLAIAELLGMSLWFSGSAVVPALVSEWKLDRNAADLLTLAVQIGFVAGTALSAFLNLPDIILQTSLHTYGNRRRDRKRKFWLICA